MMQIGLVFSGAALMAGCASAPMRTVENNTALRCDYAQMDRIERAAKITRTELHWVNCPQARDSAKSS
jgi:hypothetical protein